MAEKSIKEYIALGQTYLGIELGSTRIKAVLIDTNHQPIATGGYDWENQWEDNVWTYDLAKVWEGLRASYVALCADIKAQYGVTLETVGGIGISAMMHGYLVFDAQDQLLVPFRTWRNTMTLEASEKLTALFDYPIPQRWSIAHLYQAILKGESHLSEITFMTTLAGYVHWRLTGKKVIGIGDASGMFPIDTVHKMFDAEKIAQFNQCVAAYDYPWQVQDILPEVLVAGENAGTLTAEGAALLDPTHTLKAGIPFCPPEGDGGTGMVATNSVAVNTGNVSAGTSVFAMVVLEKQLSKVYKELDLVTTPSGEAVAMVHCNNCTSELNAWVNLFGEVGEILGVKPDPSYLFTQLYQKALEGTPDGGGLLAYNYLSGEHITGFESGRPLFVRTPESQFNLANFMRVQLMSALGVLKVGMEILTDKEGIVIANLNGHGGFFKTPIVGQRIMAAAMHTPVSVMETAGEGGAWGIALLAAYMGQKSTHETLSRYLAEKVFKNSQEVTLFPQSEDVEGFLTFMQRYKNGLSIQRAAVENFGL